jgi:hypothetical protein
VHERVAVPEIRLVDAIPGVELARHESRVPQQSIGLGQGSREVDGAVVERVVEPAGVLGVVVLVHAGRRERGDDGEDGDGAGHGPRIAP